MLACMCVVPIVATRVGIQCKLVAMVRVSETRRIYGFLAPGRIGQPLLGHG